jgi:hypothetical protein
MAAQLAASLPARSAVSAQGQQQAGGAAGKPKDGGSFNVPARMEEALDVEGNIELKEVELTGMVRC